MSTIRAGAGAKLDEMIAGGEHARIVIHEDDRIAMGEQVIDDAQKPIDIHRMQPDRWLVEHIEHACCAIAHGPRQLHALTLAGRKGARCAIQRQIAKAKIEQAFRGMQECVADRFCHLAHIRRHLFRHCLHPRNERIERHLRHFRQIFAAESRCTRSLRQSRSATIRTDVLLEKFLHTLHTLVVLDLRQRIFNGVDGIVVGKIQLASLV